MKRFAIIFAVIFACSLFMAAGTYAADNLVNMTHIKTEQISKKLDKLDRKAEKFGSKFDEKFQKYLDHRCLSIVTLSGKLNHFGYDVINGGYIDYHATVPGVSVWIAEYPFTRDLNITSDETGWWTMYVIKYKNQDLKFSFVYEKEGWITTKCNENTVTDEDNTDIAIQYIDPYYFNLAMKPMVEAMIGGPFINAMVVTVGKSWASMHSDLLPHGDPGATVSTQPPLYYPDAIGPIYFNEAVQPDPTYPYTSVDGGVTWINVTLDTYDVTAHKDGVTYDTVRFNMTEADVANGVVLYIASPPDSVQGDNDSAPGEW
ncbi:MAG: hypothetical protein DRH32_07190 [Deltaproteobacteria bacterium]|nr:MAG: hypothetical protein DRH32_07190 [Deltaproteobacteria bacterium]